MAVNDTGGELTIVHANKPTLALAEVAQPIGHAAWSERMPHRSDAQLRHVFDPDDPKVAERLLAKMESKVGTFSGVIALLDGQPVGYAWAADDVGNLSPFKQRVKTAAGLLKGQKPYAWTGHINVLPEHQGKYIGNALLTEVLAPFDDDQRPTAYVFDENGLTLDWFMARGFAPRPEKPVDPNGRPDGPDLYFGEGATHVQQWRLEAPSTQTVIGILQQRGLPQYTVRGTV